MMKTDEFWEGGTCEYCNGEIHEKMVALSRKARGKYLLIENVPAGVCAPNAVRAITWPTCLKP